MTGLAKLAIGAIGRFLKDRADRKEREAAMMRGETEELLKARLKAATLEPVRYEKYTEEVFPLFLIFGPPRKYFKRKVFYKLSQLPRERFTDMATLILILAYVAAIGYYLYQFQGMVDSIDPKAGNRFSFLGLLNFEWGKNKELHFTGGGAGLYLLAPVAGWITHRLVGKSS